jgi:hypothetical protein
VFNKNGLICKNENLRFNVKKGYNNKPFDNFKGLNDNYRNGINNDTNDISNNNNNNSNINKEKGDILSQIEQFKIDIGSFLEENDSLLKNNIPKGNYNYETNKDKEDDNNNSNNNMESQGIEVNISE